MRPRFRLLLLATPVCLAASACMEYADLETGADGGHHVDGGQSPHPGNGGGGGQNAGGGGSAVAGGSGRGGGTGSGGGAGGGGGTGSGGGGAAASGGGSGGGDAGTSPESGVCPSLAGAPPGVPPLPSADQVAYQRSELTAFIHLGLATFDGTEQGNTADAPSLFNPTNLDAAQWVKALKDAGFRQAMLTTKHSTGFCLWPSANTDYSVKNSPWRSGQGDIVKDFTDAMHAAGMRVGLYISPWDQRYPSSKSDYETYFKGQLTEILSNYGPVYEVEWDGYNAPRSLDWKGVIQHVKSLQPHALVWMGPEIATDGADLRWIGNENGQASRTSSSVGSVPNGASSAWYPFETNVSDRVPNWFWHPNNTVMSLSSLQAIYFRSVGMNTTLILNVPPNTSGMFDTPDLALLQQFGAWYGSLYQNDFLKAQPASGDSTWAASGFEAAKAVDDDICTYWAAASGKTSARLEVTPAAPITFKVLSIREPIELGERSTGYHVELKQNGTWNTSPTDASGKRIQGTVIGQRQLWQLNATTAEAIALVIDSAKGPPAIAELGAY